jgi:hypothetical protein
MNAILTASGCHIYGYGCMTVADWVAMEIGTGNEKMCDYRDVGNMENANGGQGCDFCSCHAFSETNSARDSGSFLPTCFF